MAKNCGNCIYFVDGKKEIIDTKVGKYAIECVNLVHPIEDCINKKFPYHKKIKK